MDPITIATAASLVKVLGVDKAIGRFLGGEKGERIAGKVLDVAQVVTGSRSADDIVAAVHADAELAQKLRDRLMELASEEAEREAADRANARAMQQAALSQDDLFSKRFLYWFAAAWSLFAMGYIVLITVAPIAETNLRFADTILGFLLGTIVAAIIQFFYGSSRSSQGKDSMVNNLVDTLKNKIGL